MAAMTEALAGLLFEEGDSFLETCGEIALGLLVAPHDGRAEIDGEHEGRRHRQAKAGNAGKDRRLGPDSLGSASFTCSSLDPHDAHGCDSTIWTARP